VLVPGLDATNLSMVRIIDHLGDHRPVYGLEATDEEVAADDLVGVQTLADRHEQVLADAGLHAVHLVGYSFGGLVALELAHRLELAGHPPRSLVILDTMAPEVRDGFRYHPTLWSHAAHRVWGVHRRWETVVASVDAARRGRGVADRGRRFVVRIQEVPGGWLPGGSIEDAPAEAARRAVRDARQVSAQQYDPPAVGGPTILITSSLRAQQCGDPALGWDRRMPLAQVHRVRASHRSLRYWRARPLARTIHRALDRLE
jgi:pimeloyl-ACP methyl ester carboxylesterase